jgi:hypothetical protein
MVNAWPWAVRTPSRTAAVAPEPRPLKKPSPVSGATVCARLGGGGGCAGIAAVTVSARLDTGPGTTGTTGAGWARVAAIASGDLKNCGGGSTWVGAGAGVAAITSGDLKNWGGGSSGGGDGGIAWVAAIASGDLKNCGLPISSTVG